MTCDELNFKPIEYNGETVYVARHTFTNGFTVSIILEDNDDAIFNAAILRDDVIVITEIHNKAKTFIVGNDYTFDLTDKRKVTFFLKNVDKLYPGDEFTDVHFDSNGHMTIGKKYPVSEKLMKIVKKITPFKNDKIHVNK